MAICVFYLCTVWNNVGNIMLHIEGDFKTFKNFDVKWLPLWISPCTGPNENSFPGKCSHIPHCNTPIWLWAQFQPLASLMKSRHLNCTLLFPFKEQCSSRNCTGTLNSFHWILFRLFQNECLWSRGSDSEALIRPVKSALVCSTNLVGNFKKLEICC